MNVQKPISLSEIDQIIGDEFGVNADYVGDLLHQFESDPMTVDEEWRAYFHELFGERAAAPSPTRAAEVPESSPERMPARDETREVSASTALPQPAIPSVAAPAADQGEHIPIRGPALRVAENMEASLSVPTATSQRQAPIKLLDENRRVINHHLASVGRKVSYTHLITRAVLRALEQFPQLNDAYEEAGGSAYRVQRKEVNLGIAVDVTKKDGTRSLLVPNIKGAQRLAFPELLGAYDDIVGRARHGKLQVSDFQGTTMSITNPGTIGTTASNPRLMAGQGVIVATGAIEYPPEYQSMAPEAITQLGISKVFTITSTYDHRIVQGAESGAFLALIEELLRGQHLFYDEIFGELSIPYRPYRWAIDRNPAILGEQGRGDEVRKQARVLELINAYRVRGHLIADLDPLGGREVQYHPEMDIETYGLTIWDLDRQFITGGLGETGASTLREIVDRLHRFYCGTIGVEYRNIQVPEEKEWIRARVERERWPAPTEAKKQILWKLISAELFEKFLGTKYLGQKRFSIEGAETIVALLDQLIIGAGSRGVEDITIGMSHRGRLNVIANVIGRFCERIFTSFEGSIHPDFPHDQGDVKYHQGASGVREVENGHSMNVAVLSNPSHLEFVNPVVEGLVRAKQDQAVASGREAADASRMLAVLLHGDAAFAGEGIVAETLNFSQLHGYTTRGTIHIIVNNQLGFTATPEESRSSTYSTDVAKMIQAPIFHVNGDDVEAAYRVLQIALDYRQQFHKDVVIDVLGFRRHGHNEGDEPTYTQPVMYHLIKAHPGVREIYARKLVKEGVLTKEEVKLLMDERTRRYENALLGAKAIVARKKEQEAKWAAEIEGKERLDADLGDDGLSPLPDPQPARPEFFGTSVDHHTLRLIAQAVTTVPRGFTVNPKITGLLSRRAKMVEGELHVDWGMAEALAFGSLLLEGTSVRLSGQDTERGTFSQRHASLHDTQTGGVWTPLATLAADQGRFDVYDSPLSEAGALGFEYGYSVAAPSTLVIWEAQFGDFINAAQVIVDQFIVSGEEKWNQASRLALLLPHGYEGQGPEHSSARLERFLQLCAGGNIQVVCCSKASQYFHVLRRQMKQAMSTPLVVMTPKSLLRLPDAASPIGEFTKGGFYPVLGDDEVTRPDAITRVLVCSGKVYYELDAERRQRGEAHTAILRIEQFYPVPKNTLREQLDAFPNATDVRWVQEEPANMGGWFFMAMRLRRMLRPDQSLRYAGRAASASTATGSHTIHQMEQRRLIEEAFAPFSN